MSRTDKTKPFRVKLLHRDLTFHDDHDHTRGGCDLPPLNSSPFRSPGGRCSREFQFTGTRVCACATCSGAWYERRSKKSRRDAKAQCQELVRGGEF